MSSREYQAAVWIVSYGSPDYELFETEEAAAGFAAHAMDNGQCSVLGVQFADGRSVRREDWKAYAAAEDRKLQAWAAEADAVKDRTPPPMREARDPFRHRQIEIEVSEPSWLGEPPETKGEQK